MLDLRQLHAEIAAQTPVRRVGRVSDVDNTVIHVTGLADVARLGDQVVVYRSEGEPIGGEVVVLRSDHMIVLANQTLSGLALEDRVVLLGPCAIAPDHNWVGRIVDPFGTPLDNRPLLRGAAARQILADPPPPAERRSFGPRLATGLAPFDTLLPLARGQRIGLFAGSGVGKSTLLGKLTRQVEADIVVLALIGERGRELQEFVQKVLGPEGMARAVIVAATSDQAPQVRRRAAWTAMAVAEYFRDQGMSVLFLADSITRFAEAHREVASAAGEAATLQGFPASTAQMLMGLCERAGTGWRDSGDITAIFSVLVAGSDMEGPIADIMRGVLDGHVVLDREIAERGRFPAIDILRSVSRSLPEAASDEENQVLTEARRLLGVYERGEMMVQAGLYKTGSDPYLDRAIAVWPALDAFVSQASETPEQAFAALSDAIKSHHKTKSPTLLARQGSKE